MNCCLFTILLTIRSKQRSTDSCCPRSKWGQRSADTGPPGDDIQSVVASCHIHANRAGE